MQTQEEIRAEIDRLLAEDRAEEAAPLVNRLVPVTAEEFRRRLDEAPIDDEPTTAEDRAAFDRAWAAIEATAGSRGQRPA